jgi:magnesium-transporting ATPase (P-type)
MNKGEKAGEVAYITNLFAQWNQKVDQEIWNRVQADLRESEMKLKPFANGDEFTSNLLEYINESKISASQSDYEKFESSIWTQKLKAAWLPILIDNGMLTVKQKELMQTAVDDWGSMYEEETPIYWYIAIVVIVLIIVLIFVPKWKKKNKPLAGQ